MDDLTAHAKNQELLRVWPIAIFMHFLMIFGDFE
jgi:hypothetical protein